MAAKTGSVEVQMQRIFDDATKEVKRAASNAQDKIAKEGVQKLRNTSPKKTGDYAKGWRVKRERGRGIPVVTIHNKTDYQLTHLLENGHIVRNAKGTYGRFNGIKHIAPVEEWAKDALPAEFDREFNP